MVKAATELPVQESVVAPPRTGGLVGLFGAVGFLGALLLFSVEPLAAKALLPVLGGSPAVWNTAMAFFQVALLAGYVTAHLTSTRLPARWRLPVQYLILLLPLLTLPFGLPGRRPTVVSPVWWELGALWTMVGAPFFALATLSPTAQRWFSQTDHPRARDPFFLYAASNVGSFLGLLAYPLLIEPNLDLVQQAAVFRWGYLAMCLIGAVAAAMSHRRRRPHDGELPPGYDTANASPVSHRRRLYWVGAAAVPSLMLLAVSRHIATDVASFPLLWVVPLAIYLGTFILAFSTLSAGVTEGAARLLPIFAVPAAIIAVSGSANIWVGIGLPLVLLAASGLLAHGRLYASRPDAGRVTEFYVWISVGGALGGMFGAFVAPVLFDQIAEYPIAIAATALFLTGQLSRGRWSFRVVVGLVFVGALVAAIVADQIQVVGLLLGVAGIAAYGLAGRSPWLAAMLAAVLGVGLFYNTGDLLAQERTFFGVYRVLGTSSGIHELISGTTLHGAQRFDPAPDPAPIRYYFPEGPFGRVMTSIGAHTNEIGVIGLGAGSLATYLEPGQRLTFYEIDPAVVDLATDPRLFTFTTDTEGTVEYVLGDGRLTLQEPHAPYGLLIVDAFSSDAIPTHLLTVEAVQAYLDAIAKDGVVGFHISNRHLDLEPVIGRIASELGLSAQVTHYRPTVADASASDFMVLARDSEVLSELTSTGSWRAPRIGPDLWTDSFSDLFSVIRWG